MAENLRLTLILQARDRAVEVIKRVGQGGAKAADNLRQARQSLKQLEDQARQVNRFRAVARDAAINANALQTAREKTRALAVQMAATTNPSQRLMRSFTAARREASRLKQRQQNLLEQQERLRRSMGQAGIGIKGMGAYYAGLRRQIEQATQAVKAQQQVMDKTAAKRRRLAELKQQHAKDMPHYTMIAASGASGIATGASMGMPLRATLNAFRAREEAASQLRASMMIAGGGVSDDYERIAALAARLGDRLPGTSADFYEMMTVLRKEGLSAQTILGGTAEAAAYLGVQLRIPVTEAASFAAKMQDATSATEREMMPLMDVLQRINYLGVDHGQTLAGFAKLTGVLGKLRKTGVAAANDLAPLLVMMNQDGMEDGGSAGNAIRKVIDAGLNAKRLDAAHKAAREAGVRLRLNFVDAKGNYAGLENLFAQLDKLRQIKSDFARTTILRALFGDDAETHQVISTLMKKGQAGYDQVKAKMQAQASLGERVQEQLGTLNNVIDAAQGTLNNVMAGVGEAFSEDAKALIRWLNVASESLGGWVKEHPNAVRWMARIAAGMATVMTLGGALMLVYASIMGPIKLATFLFKFFSLKIFGVAIAARAAAATMRGLALAGQMLGKTWSVLLGWLARGRVALLALGQWAGLALTKAGAALAAFGARMGAVLMALGRGALAFLATPMGLLVAVMATSAYLIWKHWDTVRAKFGPLYESIRSTITNLWTAAAEAKNKFVNAGLELMRGLASGVTSGLGVVRDAIVGAGAAVVGWFREKLGIHSPSRVFMSLGQHIPQGAAIGIERGQARLKTAALAMAAMPALAAPQLDMSQPLSAGALRPAASAPATIQITINAAPGQDAQAIARAVAAELDRRERRQKMAVRSALQDVEG